jgi:diacylglycerol kinase family enzyme
VAVTGDQLREAASRAAAAGHALVAAGGDGTVSTVAGVAAHAGRLFGVIPLGTLNHFARDAGIPPDIEAAVATLAAGAVRALDIGQIPGRVFVNNVSLGFYARIVRERQIEQRRGHAKWTSFAIGLGRAWINYRTITVRLTVDGVAMLRRTPFVFVGNGKYEAEGAELGARCALDVGRLSIYLAPECGRFEMFALALRAMAGRLTPDVKLESFVASEVTIEARPGHALVAVDGELVPFAPPLTCAIRPGALRTLIPGR